MSAAEEVRALTTPPILQPDVNWEPVCNLDWNRLISEGGPSGTLPSEPAMFRPMDEKHERCSVSFVLGNEARGLYIHSNARSCEVYSKPSSSAGPFEYCGSTAAVETIKGRYLIQLTQQACSKPLVVSR